MFLLNDSMNHILQHWSHLPALLKRDLLIGSVGKSQLIILAEKMLGQAFSGLPNHRGTLLTSGQDMLLAAWEHDPFDGAVAKQLLALHSISPYLPNDLIPLLESVSSNWNVPSLGRDYEQVLVGRTTDGAERFLERELRKEPSSLYWCRQIQRLAFMEKTWEWGRHLLTEACLPSPLDRLQARALANLAFLEGRWDIWQELAYSKAPFFSLADRCLHLGNMAFLEQNRQRAVASWAQSLLHRPWHINLILRLYDTLQGVDLERRELPGRISVCLYSYNKAKELDMTMKALAESDLGSAQIFALVNGSVDDTRSMLRSWEQRIGSSRLSIIDLPVNIGAPAARNWLMHHPSIRNADWVAYLDDDALVPQDWLRVLGAAAALYPHAGAWGCRVIDYESQHFLQSVDYHLRPPQPGSPQGEASVPFVMSMLHYEVFDTGQFNYLRPCVHVTGCCHLFSGPSLQEAGDFDLRFSPSQFDDLEHDFRFALVGRPVVYNGHLAVRHMNKTGKHCMVSTSQQGSAGANLYKLHHKYTPEEYARIMDWQVGLLEEDLLSKLQRLGDVL